MQVCTHAWGNTASIASGNPVSPSNHATRTSSTPRRCRSLRGEPEFRSLGLLPPQPEHLALPVDRDADREVAGAGPDGPVLADLDHQRVQVHDRVDPLQRPGPPRLHVGEHGVGNAADRVPAQGGGAVEALQVALDVADRHPAGVQVEDLLVQPREAGLPLRDQLRLERPGPVAGRLTSTGPSSVCTFLPVDPLRTFPAPPGGDWPGG